jgi:hypothetical protein
MLVLTHFSSMNTRRLALSFFWSYCRRAGSAAMSCSAARRIFFKGDLLLGEKAPDRAIADVDMTCGKLAPYVMQREIERFGAPSEQPVSETRMALSAPSAWRLRSPSGGTAAPSGQRCTVWPNLGHTIWPCELTL